MKIFRWLNAEGHTLGTLIYFQDDDGRWLWELRGRNCSTIAACSGSYENWSNARMGFESLMRMFERLDDVKELSTAPRRPPAVPDPGIGMIELALRNILSHLYRGPVLSADQGQFVLSAALSGSKDVRELARDDTLAGVIRKHRSR